MAFWLRINGEPVDYNTVGNHVATLHYIELEEQGGATLEQLTSGALSLAKRIAALVYLIRRHQGETLTYRQAAAEFKLVDFLGTGETPGAEEPVDPPVAPQDGAEQDPAETSPGSEGTSTAA